METPFTSEEASQCLKVLESILENRKWLGTLPAEDRKKLLTLAGKVSRPDKTQFIKFAKERRRERRAKKMAKDRSVRASTTVRLHRESAVFIPPPQVESSNLSAVGELIDSRNCYVCKKEYRQIHFFYDAMCLECAEYNYKKRFQTADLKGRVALITGSRLKIGYQSALMVLRAGAKVIATTRFPHDAAQRFSREEDYSQWKDRLQIHGLDLRHSPSVEVFAEYITRTEERLDILINNAAQTVRRPPGFYTHLMEIENTPVDKLPLEIQSVLASHLECNALLSQKEIVPLSSGEHAWVSTLVTKGAAIGLQIPALLSQVPGLKDDMTFGEEVFPEGQTDADLQQVDLRKVNSWRMKLADVPTPELLEVQLVNSIAPFILCSKLKPLMMKHRTNDKHIVNVSAMEGNFSRKTKTDKHPHTNMAKAALNMMTLTSASDYATDGIFMNAVDTGWVTDEDPKDISVRKYQEHDFQPPLDIVDGAARVCDPFFDGMITGHHMWGKFLKDYKPYSW